MPSRRSSTAAPIPAREVAYPASEEILREQIEEALESWDDACGTGIADHPDNVTVEEGQDAQFTVVAGGTGSGEYQWQKLSSGQWLTLINFPGQISGATTGTLTIIGAEEGNEGSYRCRITKICGTSIQQRGDADGHPGRPDAGARGAADAPGHALARAQPVQSAGHAAVRVAAPDRPRDAGALRRGGPAGAGRCRRRRWPPGAHEFTWNGTDDGGRRMSSGTYLARLRAGGEVATHRVVMVE